jgi:hypothetical protein
MKQKGHLKLLKRSPQKENSTDGYHFKPGARNVIISAASVLDETWALWEIDPSSKNLREKFYLLEYYLDYLKRFSEEEA